MLDGYLGLIVWEFWRKYTIRPEKLVLDRRRATRLKEVKGPLHLYSKAGTQNSDKTQTGFTYSIASMELLESGKHVFFVNKIRNDLHHRSNVAHTLYACPSTNLTLAARKTGTYIVVAPSTFILAPYKHSKYWTRPRVHCALKNASRQRGGD